MADIEEPVVIESVQPQCQFFVVRKKRFCRMSVRPGRQYCSEHEPQPDADHAQTDLRIPCPNDPKHTCYLSKLDQHLVKCNARQGETPPYIKQNINAPPDTEPCPRVPLRDVPVETLSKLLEKVNVLFDKYVKDKISTFTPAVEQHAAVQEDLEVAGRTDTSRRHLRQAARLLHLAQAQGLVAEDTCYIELGAGKGMLSYYMGVSWCGGTSRVLAVDRAALRHKRDNRLRGRSERLRADLRHLALAGAPPVANMRAVVGLAKHLCGVATDYAVRCLTSRDVVSKTRGALLATCCHHRCERGPYVGRKPLQELGVTAGELDVMFGVVSWATCGDGRSRAAPRAPAPAPAGADYTFRRITEAGTFQLGGARAPPALLPPAARAELGRRAKALIDYGRVLYLRQRGFHADLCYYVPLSESLENVCIVARKDL